VNPTPYLVVSNMFNPEDETERNWDLDLAEDVKGEVERQYGHVRRIKVDKMSAVSEGGSGFELSRFWKLSLTRSPGRGVYRIWFG
jgi:hypothetical protein